MKKLFILFFLFVLVLGFACSKSDSGMTTAGGTTVDCSGAAKTFVTDVNPIIQQFCNTAGCHASGSSNGPGPITNYAQVFNARASIRSAIATGEMPQNATLTTAQKNGVLCWIDNGAPNN